MKKILTLLLLMSAAITGWAEDFTDSNGIQYTVTNGEAQITGYGGSSTVVIPAQVTIDGTTYNVTSIGDNAFRNKSLTKITFAPNSNVKTIGAFAFESNSFSEITIPNSVTSLSYHVFDGSRDLKKVVLSTELTAIPSATFQDCTALNDINLDKLTKLQSIGDYAFNKCRALGYGGITIPNSVKTIGQYAFHECTSSFFENVTLPSSLESIGEYAFNGCTNLKTVTIGTPSALTDIGEHAFMGCTALTSFNIPSGVSTINYETFSGCSALESITIPSGVSTIDQDAFQNCSALKSITIPSGVTTINNLAFRNSGIESISIPNTVTVMGNSVFSGCNSLETITFEKGSQLETITKYNFDNIANLKTLVLPTGLKTMQTDAFKGSPLLTNVTFGSLPAIEGNSCFSDDTKNNGTFSVNLTDDSYIGTDLSNYHTTTFATVKYQRTMGNQWGTLCLPFDVTFTGSEPYDFYEFTSYDSANNSLTLTKVAPSTLAAKTPIIVRRNGAAKGIEFQGSNVTITEADLTGTHNGTNLTGNFAPTKINSGYYIGNDQFWNAAEVAGGVNVKAFRAWIPATAISSSSNKALSISVSEDVTTGILQLLNNDNGQNRYYDLNGREMNDLQQGVNIVKTADGKTRKVIIK